MTDQFTNMVMKEAAEAVSATLDSRHVSAHFALLVFTPGGVNYIGTGTRESIAEAMREVLGRWDDPHEAIHISPDGGNDAADKEGPEDQAGNEPDLRKEEGG